VLGINGMNEMKYRKPKIPDFPFILNKLINDGMTAAEVAEIIGVSRTVISNTRTEARDLPPGWLASYYLLDLYIRKYDRPVPFFGEHNE
jgi:hypothetical protein